MSKFGRQPLSINGHLIIFLGKVSNQAAPIREQDGGYLQHQHLHSVSSSGSTRVSTVAIFSASWSSSSIESWTRAGMASE